MYGIVAAVWLVPEISGHRIVENAAFRAAPLFWAAARFAWRAFVISSLLSFTMMLWDRATIRWGFVAFVVFVGGITALVWPVLLTRSVAPPAI